VPENHDVIILTMIIRLILLFRLESSENMFYLCRRFRL